MGRPAKYPESTPRAELSLRQLEAVVLREQGFTYQQIADRLGINTSSVRDRLRPEARLARRHAWIARKRQAERESKP